VEQYVEASAAGGNFDLVMDTVGGAMLNAFSSQTVRGKPVTDVE